jgi:hypothetical protein
MSKPPAIPVNSDLLSGRDLRRRVAVAKVSVNDSETIRPLIEHPLWFHSREQSDANGVPGHLLSARPFVRVPDYTSIRSLAASGELGIPDAP